MVMKIWSALAERLAGLLTRLGLCSPGKVMYIGGSDTLPTPLRNELSIDEPLNVDWDGNELLLSDILGTESDLVMRPIEADVDRQLLHRAMDSLEPRERKIITLRFGLDGQEERTQKEVADVMGISQSYISRLEKRIIARLKKEMLRMM